MTHHAIRRAFAAALISGPISAVPIGAAPSEVALQLQQSASIRSDVSVRFVGFADNRCPSDVACIHPGHVAALLQVFASPAPPRFVALEWPLRQEDAQLSNTAFGFRFCLLSIDPRPHSQRPVDPASYKLRMRVGTERDLPECKNGA
jgi:hypothetical protein